MFKFGPHTITKNEIFYASKLSFGLVNLKPIVPGHVLCITRRVVSRFTELTPEEVSDLFRTAQIIAQVVEKQYNGTSLNIAIQDGEAAGQSVPHCHVHILPRRSHDYKNTDDVYKDLETAEGELGGDLQDKDNNVRRPGRGLHVAPDDQRFPRTPEDMAKEASVLRKLLNQPDDIWS
ncbi:hypothetical protein HK098_002396 [Nowakowskiella sp. JEL0407]|nr:hypothetical protein HK098_002396 [Nowakowskiella sp. JEL0407]